MKKILLSSAALSAFAGAAMAACPAVTVSDPMGIAAGAFPQQYELTEFQGLADCSMDMSENPDIGAMNARIRGNPEMPALAMRLPSEPLVVAPYDTIGSYGGMFNALSNATEAGTSDFMSVRHVNLVRFSDDLTTIVPHVAKSWAWNDDYTQLTFVLREGHKWSDGQPFTAEDVAFWYENLNMDTNVIEVPKAWLLAGGEKMTVDVVDPLTVRFNMPAPKLGFLAHFANHYGQGFQPKHFLGQFHPDINADADSLAQSFGFENGYDAIKAYYGSSDWMDTPTPMLAHPDKVANLPLDAAPTLESHIVIGETTEGRQFVANPYFFQVDTAGNQLPYINEMDEIFVGESEVRLLKLVNGEVDYKAQALQTDYVPLLMESQEKGGFVVDLKPDITMPTFAFNVTSEDPEKRKVFGDLKFRQAMSVAMNRDEINEVAMFGLGTPQQYVGFSPSPDFITAEWTEYFTQYDPAMAKTLLDEIGVVDTDGDGMRELPNGDALTLNLQVATQGMSIKIVELVGQSWREVGINNTVKEVTTDEYRSAQSSNQLDVTMWEKSVPLTTVLGNPEIFIPPFDNYFNMRTAMLWGEWVESDGTAGVEPPAYVLTMMEDINAFQAAAVGSPESDALGLKLVENMTGNLLFIGTVKEQKPIYRAAALKNVPPFKTASYAYYRTYPYRPSQWFLDE
ncbi:ABC transporter substrate-binding protein [Sulfitobacter sp. TSTF-M16]|uniref:ABC transporter substrate-binding protein n=2 Tax=Sulfitobacter aestuariivivens TaxID=2766981 RepID=A0A927D5M4_9RHOB|nr:ABC transporter substrate-binding protein [Sulfitobacter aestuariivivens]MBD3663687.1 ABC transporter substrate-binding protein [Sulfitobacter aestuariivivens]